MPLITTSPLSIVPEPFRIDVLGGLTSIASRNPSELTVIYDIDFSPDGTSMIVIGTLDIYQYTLSSPWNVTTASFTATYDYGGDFSGFDNATSGTILANGTKFYTYSYDDKLARQYTMSTPWDVSTASYDTSYDIGSNVATQAYTIEVSGDGTKLYLMGGNHKNVYQIDLSTPYDIGTAVYNSILYDVDPSSSLHYSIHFQSNGYRFWLLSNTRVYQYTLTTAWDVTSASYDNRITIPLEVPDEDNHRGIYVHPDGTYMYIGTYTEDLIRQYSIS